MNLDEKLDGWMEGGVDDIWDEGDMTGEGGPKESEESEEPEEPEEWSEWSRCTEDCKQERSRKDEVEEQYCKIGVDDCEGKSYRLSCLVSSFYRLKFLF